MIGAQYQQITMRVDSLQLRERVLLLIVSIVMLYFLADSMGFQPIFKNQQLLLQDINDQGIQLEILRARSTQLYREPTDEQSIPIVELQQELTSFGNKLQLRLDSMLSPDKATSILEQVMTHEDGLTLNAVNTRLTSLTSIEADTGKSIVFEDINRYEIELQLEGGYLETLYYLRALEALPWRFFWTGITYVTTEYPKASVDLEIYTFGQPGI